SHPGAAAASCSSGITDTGRRNEKNARPRDDAPAPADRVQQKRGAEHRDERERSDEEKKKNEIEQRAVRCPRERERLAAPDAGAEKAQRRPVDAHSRGVTCRASGSRRRRRAR